MIEPIAATVAGDDPEIAAKNIDASTVTSASPPESAPTILFAKAISLLEIPPFSMRLPAIIKKGMAIRGKESIEAKSFCPTTMSGTESLTTIETMAARQRLAAIGTLQITRRMKTPNSTYIIDPPHLLFSIWRMWLA